MGYFHVTWFLKLVFPSSLIRKYILYKGFYDNFNIKKHQVQGALPSDPHQVALPPGPLLLGVCPLDRRGCSAPYHFTPVPPLLYTNMIVIDVTEMASFILQSYKIVYYTNNECLWVQKTMVQIFSWGERWNVPFNEAKPSWMVHYIYIFHRMKIFVPLHEWENKDLNS